jgi:hypothetical protein
MVDLVEPTPLGRPPYTLFGAHVRSSKREGDDESQKDIRGTRASPSRKRELTIIRAAAGNKP